MRLTNKHLFLVKAFMHWAALAPIVFLVLAVFYDEAGGDPVQYIIHYTGMGALNTLVLMLLISPVAKRFKQGALIQTRRLVGLYVFAYATLHLAAFISLDLLFEWSLFFTETVKRPYILVGMLAYILLFALAITSINAVKRKMGKRWQQLHNSVYVVALLVPLHFIWSVKSEIIEPSIYIALTALLLWARKDQIKRIFNR
ncbi:protein-methionine-sulfoxide reductase heme-binding subunit MsrQ [Psychrobium sp. MM17-31]|uniref:protein-methionine-sulfoxide reductase heme-binding subunit MsrQ n=1 Tax=Psychrobium sp. MM17-31 TaxID=2917758 RepID=UPI001EF7286D|nr:protein-methionine-sulfoxide reductase heme-binding subunit MsrQ [Psychrobium sp. MM17-31]MCG7532654.1 protein-methionine-sulfoxide reductase heme-binding subunit MsrQ [Psychrobium sp. MM17-31]